MSSTSNPVYIVEAIRTPIGRREGGLRGTHPVDLAAHALKALVARAQIEVADVEDIAFGCVSQTGEQGGNIISVEHRRLALDVPAKGAEFDIEVETRDAQHTAELVDALTAAGYPPKRL